MTPVRRARARVAAVVAATLALGACGKVELVRIYFQERQFAEDREIDGLVKGALLADPGLRDVEPETFLREVTLTGEVPVPSDKIRAEEIASGTSGVDRVRNEITVKHR